jgi:hypothetical protein
MLDHIVLGCVFSRQVWHLLLSRIGLADVVAHGDVDLFVWWTWARCRAPRHCRKGFDSLIMLTCWSLWKERNARTFNNEITLALGLCLKILEEATLWLRAGFSCLSSLLSLL